MFYDKIIKILERFANGGNEYDLGVISDVFKRGMTNVFISIGAITFELLTNMTVLLQLLFTASLGIWGAWQILDYRKFKKNKIKAEFQLAEIQKKEKEDAIRSRYAVKEGDTVKLKNLNYSLKELRLINTFEGLEDLMTINVNIHSFSVQKIEMNYAVYQHIFYVKDVISQKEYRVLYENLMQISSYHYNQPNRNK